MSEPRPPEQTPGGQPAYQQPPQAPYQSAAGWGQPQAGWGPAGQTTTYGSSIGAIVAGLLLVVLGLPVTLVGAFLTFFGGRLFENPFATAPVDALGGGFTIFGAVILVIGILHLLSGIFAWMHRSWARSIGVIVGVLGVLLGVVGLVRSAGPETDKTQQAALVASLVIVVVYAIVVVGLVMGGRHFRREHVQ